MDTRGWNAMIFADSITRRTVLHFISTGAIIMATSQTTPAHAASSASFAVTTPIHIASVSMRVRDLGLMTAYYRDVIGLDLISGDLSQSVLGKDGLVLLTLIARPADSPDDKISAGLYHTAFLMPSRQALGEWLITVARNGIKFTGFADHLVSEATYLDDPEGNGIEVYADRSPVSWKWNNGSVQMATEELDIDGLVRDQPQDRTLPYVAPSGLRIGHVHLRVGDVAKAEDFYIGTAGLERMASVGGSATFLANGHYHHHIGANVWQSRNAGPRKDTMSGLENLAFSTALPLMDGLRSRLKASGADFHEQGDVVEALDPWGTRVRFIPTSSSG
jgi:catechol 2,3-dioxygenase